jgi:hypothetical protein
MRKRNQWKEPLFKSVAEAEKAVMKLSTCWSAESRLMVQMSLLNLKQNERIIKLLELAGLLRGEIY